MPSAEPEREADQSSDDAADGESAPWPDEAVEAAMLLEQRDRGDRDDVAVPTPKTTRNAAAESAAPAGPLPALDEVVARIPEHVRETLEELFRARFTTVQWVPAELLKTPSGDGPASAE